MAYNPPFRRPGFSIPTGETPTPTPNPTGRGTLRNKATGNSRFKVVIHNAPGHVRHVMFEQWKSQGDNDGPLLVNFVPAKFPESYADLADKVIYVTAPATAPVFNTLAPRHFGETGANFSSRSSTTSFDDFASALDESLGSIPDSIPAEEEEQNLKRAVLKTVRTRISPSLRYALTMVQAKAADVKPNTELGVKLVVRFGTLLMYSPVRRRRLEHLNPVQASLLERQLCGERTMPEIVYRNLETSLPEPVFEQIEQVADSDAHLRTMSTEKYSIQVFDKQRSNMLLKVTCVRVDDKDHAKARTLPSRLKIPKVKLDHERHMNLDVCPLGYETNFRLLLTTQVSYVELEEDVRTGLQDIVDKAIVDPTVDGGLRWPFGSVNLANSEGEGRFAVRRVRSSEDGFVYKNSDRRWKLRRVNGVDFDFSFGRKTKEVEMAPVKWKQLLKRKISYKPSLSKDQDEEVGSGNGIVSSGNETSSWIIDDIVDELPGLVEWLAENIP